MYSGYTKTHNMEKNLIAIRHIKSSVCVIYMNISTFGIYFLVLKLQIYLRQSCTYFTIHICFNFSFNWVLIQKKTIG